MALILSRKQGEVVHIGKHTSVRVLEIRDGSVTLAITAPNDVQILRNEAVARKPKTGAPIGATRRDNRGR